MPGVPGLLSAEFIFAMLFSPPELPGRWVPVWGALKPCLAGLATCFVGRSPPEEQFSDRNKAQILIARHALADVGWSRPRPYRETEWDVAGVEQPARCTTPYLKAFHLFLLGELLLLCKLCLGSLCVLWQRWTQEGN